MTEPSPPPLRPAEAQPAPARLALLGHDLRAAVSDVLGGIRLIDLAGLDEASRLQIERVRAAGEGLARLMEESLSLMLEDPDRQPQDPRLSILQMARFLYDAEVRWSGRAREKGLSFSLDLADDLPPVVALDRVALERITANMLSNAIKYTDRGGVRMQVGLTAERALRIAVRDQGPGFSQAALARLFQREGRPSGTPKPGSGLGLHISHELAAHLGGRVLVWNLPEGGAEVAVELPESAWRADACPVAPDAPGGDATRALLPDLSEVKILVAEDSATNQAIIGQMLARMGAEYAMASDGLEAIHWLEREDFDLALVDIEMPRLSGIDVIRALRAGNGPKARMPVLAVTAYVLRANRDAIYAAGADGILAKPLPSLESFGRAIASALGRARVAELRADGPDPAQGPALGDGLSALDPDQIDRMAEMDSARLFHLLDIAGPEGGRELLDRLGRDLAASERALVAALAEPDRGAIRATTHVLIALAGAVGAERLQALSEALNTAAHRRDDAAMGGLGAASLAALDRLIAFLATVEPSAPKPRPTPATPAPTNPAPTNPVPAPPAAPNARPGRRAGLSAKKG